jgi:hypothetical protein
MDSEDQGMATDLPLAKGEALAKDKLARRPFAESAVRALRSVSASSGFSISIEGTWGQSYAVPKEPGLVDAFWSPAAMKKHAQARLTDDLLKYPARAAWQSVLVGKPLFGQNGKVASR